MFNVTSSVCNSMFRRDEYCQYSIVLFCKSSCEHYVNCCLGFGSNTFQCSHFSHSWRVHVMFDLKNESRRRTRDILKVTNLIDKTILKFHFQMFQTFALVANKTYMYILVHTEKKTCTSMTKIQNTTLPI